MHQALVLSAAVTVAFCNYGILQAYGSLFTATLEKYGEGRSKTSLVNSLLAGTSLGAGVVAGYLIRRFSLRVVSTIGSVLLPLGFIASYFATSVTFLLISIGIVSGLGISFAYVSAVVVVGTVISERHKTFALSIQNVACGVPGIVVPYLFAWLTKTYTLSGTFLIYGGITLNNLAATILFSSVKLNESIHTGVKNEDSAFEKDKQVHFTNIDPVTECQGRTAKSKTIVDDTATVPETVNHCGLAERVTFVLYAVSVPLVVATVGGIQVIYQDIGKYKGLSTAQTLACISAFNIASTVGRFFPMIFQKVSKNPFVSPTIASLAGVSGQVIILMSSQYRFVLIGYVLTGITDGGVSGSISVVIFRILSKESQTMGFGLVLTMVGILGTASGPIYGAIFDQTGSYTLVLRITTSSFTTGSVFFVVCFVLYGRLCCRS